MTDNFRNNLKKVAERDVTALEESRKLYGDSWKKRGGVGAFFTIVRKIDRFENLCKAKNYDLFEALSSDQSAEGAFNTLVDLRRYLLLVEEEMNARGIFWGNDRDYLDAMRRKQKADDDGPFYDESSEDSA
jgi:hypothetical protein